MKNAAIASCERTNTNRYAMGLADVLTIIFVVLKLCKLIDWPWVWVLSPLWISMAIVAVICLFVFTVWAISSRKKDRRD